MILWDQAGYVYGAGRMTFHEIRGVHIIYRHPLILFITFIGGLAWGTIFIKQPNIWAVSLSHSLLGALAMGFHLI